LTSKHRDRAIQIVVIYATALLLNYVWEMLQMPFYNGMKYIDPNSWLICLWASIGDANIILFIFILGRLLFGNWEWVKRLNVKKLVYLFLIGTTIAILFEIRALNTGRWSYSQLMPTFSSWGIGVVPVIQLITLPILSIRLAIKLPRLMNRKIKMS
jgi:hypothetical protein